MAGLGALAELDLDHPDLGVARLRGEALGHVEAEVPLQRIPLLSLVGFVAVRIIVDRGRSVGLFGLALRRGPHQGGLPAPLLAGVDLGALVQQHLNFGIGEVVAMAEGDIAVEETDPVEVEKRARAITPENPIPRRLSSVAPEYPPEAEGTGAYGSVSVQLTLDEEKETDEILTQLAMSEINVEAEQKATE